MAVTFLKQAFAAKGTKTEFVFLPPKRAMEAFLKGEGLLIGSSALFDNQNFTMLRLTMVRAGIYQVSNEAGLKKVAYLRGAKRAQQALKEKGHEPFAVFNYEVGLKMLRKGRVGGFLAQNTPINYQVAHIQKESSVKLNLVRRDFYKDAGGLISNQRDLPLLLAFKKFISTKKMRALYRKIVNEELSPYLGSFKLEDYYWDDFSIIELNKTDIQLSH